MLIEEQNKLLVQVGPGTPMGELLRCYWHPVTAVSELLEKRIKPVRLLGEDLVLFAVPDGPDGLISRNCAHRGADLSYGWVDGNRLRCSYHGWAFDGRGHCVEQPFELASGASGFREKVKVKSYSTKRLGGLVWAYLGPGEAPQLPDFEPYSWRRGFAEISMTVLPCNWFQCHENGVDPVHFEWLHTNWTSVWDNPDILCYGAEHLAIDFAEFRFGWICGRKLGQANVNLKPASVSNRIDEGGMLCLWPYTLVTGPTMEWRVPMDDEHTLNITRQYSVLPGDIPAFDQDPDSVPYWYGPLTHGPDDQMITSHTLNQDFAAWVGQGVIADRARERLGRTDAGIIRLRRRFLEEIKLVADGRDPAGTIRDPAENIRVELPVYMKSRYVDGVSRQKFAELLQRQRCSAWPGDGYLAVQAGRPEHVRRLFEKAAGLTVS